MIGIYHEANEDQPKVTLLNLKSDRLDWRAYRSLGMALWLGLADLLSIAAAFLCAFVVSVFLGAASTAHSSLRLAPFLLLLPSLYCWQGLYSPVGLGPVEELRRLAASTTIGCLLIAAVTFWLRGAADDARLFLFCTWLCALVFVQSGRWLFRGLAIRLNRWGEPAAIFGGGPQARQVADFLARNPLLGMLPVLVETNRDALLDGATAIVIIEETPAETRKALVDGQEYGFRKLILINDFCGVSSLGGVSLDFQGLYGLELSRGLPGAWRQAAKRFVDLCILLPGGLLLLPVILLLALLVRIDSPGNVFYCHERYGYGGRSFKLWKFRTMVSNADRALGAFLEQDPQARREWAAHQKIKNDPRVTRMGKLLRRYSLDELPQLWNVLLGEMSLVGPRPIVAEEIQRYGETYPLYIKTRPGLTGLWQVSGRNNLPYEERVRIDAYYVRNWSPWLDIYILLKTCLTVIRRDGAY